MTRHARSIPWTAVRFRAGALALTLLMALVAGCIESPEAVPDTEAGTTMIGEDGEVVTVDASFEADGFLSLDAEEGPMAFAESFSGSFDPSRHNFPQNAVRGPLGQPSDNVAFHDITHLVPAGIPTLVTSVFSTTGASNAGMWHWIAGPNDVFWTYDQDADGTEGQVSTVVVREADDAIQAAVWYGHVEANDVAYEIDVSTASDPALFPAALLWGLRLEPGEALEVRYESTTSSNALWAWGPDDAFLGVIPATGTKASLVVPTDTEGGEYVVFVPEYQPAHRFRLVDADGDPLADQVLEGRMRLLEQVIQIDVEVALDAGQHGESFTLPVPVQPVQVGYSWFTPSNAADIAIEFGGPNGALDGFQADGPLVAGAGGFFNTDMGPEGLVAGDYVLDYADTASSDVTLNMWYVTYGR